MTRKPKPFRGPLAFSSAIGGTCSAQVHAPNEHRTQDGIGSSCRAAYADINIVKETAKLVTLYRQGNETMPQSEPTRVYVQTANDQFGRLLWVHNNRPNEMLLGAYGLDGHSATITYEFPEQIHTQGESRKLRLLYKEASPVRVKVDHFTCHADGTFHAKARNSKMLYSQVEHLGEPLGRASPPFLRVLFVSDKLHRYESITGEPKKPHIWFRAAPESILVMNLVFSGVNYPWNRRVSP